MTPEMPRVILPDEAHVERELAVLLDGHRPQDLQDSTPPQQRLAKWLYALVYGREYGVLADLRRPAAVTRARLTAAAYAPIEAQRATYEYVAFLFARYHAGKSTPSPGFGTTGDALRRIGSPGARGIKDPGACRLLERLAASRRLPTRHLQHAIERCRACDVAPPNWVRLIDDLCAWGERDAQVRYEWARSFYTPTFDNPRESHTS